MLTVRPAAARGHADHGWLDSRHTFSFADYHDPKHMGFRALRVINEDRVAPGQGFGTHPHANMEIVSYPLDGAIQHRDSMGNGSVIGRGEVQRMSAGTGVTHSEFNASRHEVAHFLQIWLLPTARNTPPGYAQKAFDAADQQGRLQLVVSPDGRDGSLSVRSDASLYVGRFDAGEQTSLALAPGRHAWVQVARGRLKVNDVELSAGDGAALSQESVVRLEGLDAAEVLVFDLG